MEKVIKATNVFERNWNAGTRIVVNEGGTRSSKTYSIIQVLIMQALQQRDCIFTIARKTLPSLKTSVMRDFFSILQEQDLYDNKCHNKSDHTYWLVNPANNTRNLFEFISMDTAEKKKGAKRDYLFINEVMEFTFEDFQQLIMRTTKKAFIDYNPSEVIHWVYDKVIPRDDCTYIHSTYLDNPFIEPEVIKEIEYLRDTDETYWTIYGLGGRAVPLSLIYPVYQTYTHEPENTIKLYGIDFGYNHPAVLMEINIKENDLYIRELIYQTHLTNSQFIDLMKEHIPNYTHAMIYADSARPDLIEEIYKAGFYGIQGSEKGADSVKNGIDYVKRFKHFLHVDSVNTQKEHNSYKWRQDRAGNILDEPVKFFDDAMDAVRYPVWSYAKEYLMRDNGGLRKW